MPALDRFLGYATFCGMCAIAVAFAEERIAFSDLAYHTFAYAQTGGELQIQSNRWVAVLTQWVPIVLVKLEAPIWLLELGYSLAFPALYAVCWWLLAYPLRARDLALGWALTWLTYSVHTQYYVPSELTQGLAVFVVALACTRRFGEVLGRYARVALPIAMAVALFAAGFAHPVIVIPVTYCLAVQWWRTPGWRPATVVAGAVFYGSYALRQVFFRTYYDEQSGTGIRQGLEQLLAGELPYSVRHFADNVTWDYALFVAAFVGALALLLRRRAYVVTFLTAGFTLGHLALVALSYPTPATTDFYIEHLYLPAGFVTAMALGHLLVGRLESLRAPKWLALAALAVVLRFGYVGYVGRSVYTTRVEFLRKQLDAHAGRKVVVRETPELLAGLYMTWATPFEAWLLRAREGKPAQGYLVLPNPADRSEQLGDPGAFVSPWGAYYYAYMPDTYFTNPDPSRGYELVEER